MIRKMVCEPSLLAQSTRRDRRRFLGCHDTMYSKDPFFPVSHYPDISRESSAQRCIVIIQIYVTATILMYSTVDCVSVKWDVEYPIRIMDETSTTFTTWLGCFPFFHWKQNITNQRENKHHGQRNGNHTTAMMKSINISCCVLMTMTRFMFAHLKSHQFQFFAFAFQFNTRFNSPNETKRMTDVEMFKTILEIYYRFWHPIPVFLDALCGHSG